MICRRTMVIAARHPLITYYRFFSMIPWYRAYRRAVELSIFAIVR
jgi:hypothetical protein